MTIIVKDIDQTYNKVNLITKQTSGWHNSLSFTKTRPLIIDDAIYEHWFGIRTLPKSWQEKLKLFERSTRFEIIQRSSMIRKRK